MLIWITRHGSGLVAGGALARESWGATEGRLNIYEMRPSVAYIMGRAAPAVGCAGKGTGRRRRLGR